jgi:hypothetical protein
MNRGEARNADRRTIERETDAEIAFGMYLERAGVDCDAFMAEWHIGHSQFNAISHYLFGLTDDLSCLPPALAVMLAASRKLHAQAA